MNGIYNVLDNVFGIQNIGICIIIFTVIIYTLMIPLTIKQQKWSKDVSCYESGDSEDSEKICRKEEIRLLMMKTAGRNADLIYEKYGTSPTGGCLPMLIQMPMLFALYPVIQ